MCELREARRLSQSDLGELAGLSLRVIGRLERGERGFSVDDVLPIVRALGVPLHELFDVAPEPGGELAELLMLIKSMASDDPAFPRILRHLIAATQEISLKKK